MKFGPRRATACLLALSFVGSACSSPEDTDYVSAAAEYDIDALEQEVT